MDLLRFQGGRPKIDLTGDGAVSIARSGYSYNKMLCRYLHCALSVWPVPHL